MGGERKIGERNEWFFKLPIKVYLLFRSILSKLNPQNTNERMAVPVPLNTYFLNLFPSVLINLILVFFYNDFYS